MEDKEAKAVLEAMLFIAGEPLGLDALKKLVELDKPRMDQLLKELVNEYSLRNSGILIVEVAEGYQMVTNPACSPYVRKLISTAVPKRLSPSSLETIAIIAYKQPIIKAEIEAIRGVNSDGVIKTLLERRLIKILGRKEAPGRPLMYGTTHEFLQYFGLKDLSELPTLKELNEIDIPELPEELPDDPGEQENEAVPDTSDAGPEERAVQDESLEASPEEDENPPLNSRSEEEQDSKAVKD
ncbi:MAG: SMC-Scp complex subunit ScpB [Nitrospiraceae bacterium]|nr:MAG: SMC-Scp complex subunit ScpB [Nitrospiraceae bacterium]